MLLKEAIKIAEEIRDQREIPCELAPFRPDKKTRGIQIIHCKQNIGESLAREIAEAIGGKVVRDAGFVCVYLPEYEYGTKLVTFRLDYETYQQIQAMSEEVWPPTPKEIIIAKAIDLLYKKMNNIGDRA